MAAQTRKTGGGTSPPQWARELPERTLFLLDGFNYIFRAYHSGVSFVTRSGVPTGTFTVFGNMLLLLLKDFRPEYLSIVFESRTGNVRTEILPELKANRPEPPPDFSVQIPYIERLIHGMGIPLLSTEGYEADDTIASLAVQWLKEGDRLHVPSHVLVMSGDKDLLTLVSDRLWVFDPMNRKIIRADEVREKWGVDPVRIPDLLAIMGDASDNIPGVPGIGPKTAAKILEGNRTAEDVLDHLSDVTPDRIRNLLEQHRETILRNKKVTILHMDLSHPGDGEALKLASPDMDVLKTLLEEMEAPNLLSRVQRWATEGDLRKQGSLFDAAQAPVSTEAVSLPAEFPVRGIDYVPGEGFWRHEGERIHFIPAGDRQSVREWISDWARHPEAIWTFDQATLFRDFPEWGDAEFTIVFDAVLAAYLVNPGHRSYTLEDSASRFFMDLPGSREQSVRIVLGRLVHEIGEAGLDVLLKEVEIPLGRVLFRMEREGVRIDSEALGRARADIEKRIDGLEKTIYELAGETFTILSPKQVGEILYGKLNLPTARKGKTGYSTDEESLAGLSSLHPLPERILEYRQMKKFLSTYVEPIEKGRDGIGRLHGQFNQTVAATGRLSSSNPNLQNIPTRSEVGKEIRRCFIAKDGWVLLSADYSQIELRLLAHFTQDPELLGAFARDEDIHARTARLLFGDPVTPETRRKAKTINFGVLYGMSSFRLAQDLGVAPGEARSFIDRYFGAFAKVGPFFESIVEKARITGEVRTILGRLRKIPELKAPDRKNREYGERMAVNTVLQGSAADLIKKSMVDVAREIEANRHPDRLLIQVHDELLFEIPENRSEEAGSKIRAMMENALPLAVPVVVQVGRGRNWVEAHPG